MCCFLFSRRGGTLCRPHIVHIVRSEGLAFDPSNNKGQSVHHPPSSPAACSSAQDTLRWSVFLVFEDYNSGFHPEEPCYKPFLSVFLSFFLSLVSRSLSLSLSFLPLFLFTATLRTSLLSIICEKHFVLPTTLKMRCFLFFFPPGRLTM